MRQSPPAPKTTRTPARPVPGSLQGPCWHRGAELASLGDRATWPRQPHYQPPDGCCWAMAASQPRGRAAGELPFVIRDGRSALGLFFLPGCFFFFPLPSGKQYLSVYIMLASPERPAASAADLSPLLRTVPGGAGGSERRSRAQGPSGSHAAWPGPSPTSALASTAWERAAPAPTRRPGLASPCWERRGIAWRVPLPTTQAAAPGDGDPRPAEPGCLRLPGHADHGHPLSQCSPLLLARPSSRPWARCFPCPASSPARSQLAVGGLAPSPLTRSRHGPCHGQELGCTRSRGKPAAGAGGAAGCRCKEVCPLPFLPFLACTGSVGATGMGCR